MSDENRTDTPYQPPAPSDEPLAKKDFHGPQAKPDPIHRQVQWLGYGYVPLVIGLISISEGIDRFYILFYSAFALLLLLPLYGLVILGLTAQRTLRKTNSIGLTLFQILSMVLPILWLLFVMNFPIPA